MPTWSSGISLKGATGNSIRSGNGAPQNTFGVDGDFYLVLDASPPVLLGPKANGVWPTSGVSTGGTIIRQSQGVPQPSLGNAGDFAIDQLNGFLYGPKTTANGWLGATPISIVGPTGPSGQIQPQFGTFSIGYGPAGYINALSLSSTPTVMNVGAISGTPNYFVPSTASAFMGAQVVNYGASAAPIVVQLYNNTTSTVVYSYSSVAVGTVTSLGTFATTDFPLVANQSYSLRVTGSGSTSCYVVPLYLFQCGAPQGISTFAPFTLNNVTLSASAILMNPAGFTANTMYYNSPRAGYLYSVQAIATGTASASISFGGFTTSAVTAANSPQTFGPFVAASNALSPATNYTASVTGSGTGSVIMIPSIVS